MLCLLYVAISDAPLNVSETEFIRAVVQESQQLLPLDGALEDCRRNPVSFQESALQRIAAYRLSNEEMWELLRHCVIMCQIDLKRSELQAMKTLCMTLRQPENLVTKVVESVQQHTQDAVY